jgi:hypothetical protein
VTFETGREVVVVGKDEGVAEDEDKGEVYS